MRIYALRKQFAPTGTNNIFFVVFLLLLLFYFIFYELIPTDKEGKNENSGIGYFETELILYFRLYHGDHSTSGESQLLLQSLDLSGFFWKNYKEETGNIQDLVI